MKHRIAIDSKGNLKIWRRRQDSQDEPQQATVLVTPDSDGQGDWNQLELGLRDYLEKSLEQSAGASKRETGEQ